MAGLQHVLTRNHRDGRRVGSSTERGRITDGTLENQLDGDTEFVARRGASLGCRVQLALIVMARGWESKSIEDQQAEAERAVAETKRAPLTAKQQRRETLQLSRSQLQSQLEHVRHETHRQMLNGSLQALDKELAQLEPEQLTLSIAHVREIHKS